MKKGKLFILAALSLFFSACEDPVTFDQEQLVLDALYECIDLAPDQWAAKMNEIGLPYEKGNEFLKSFTTVNTDSPLYSESELLTVTFMMGKNSLHYVGYGRNLNYDKNPAAHFKHISDHIAAHGYSDWYGTYRDASTENTEQFTESRDNLHARVNNSYLTDSKTEQSYTEYFVYTHTDGTQWNGRFSVSGSFSGSKDIEVGSDGSDKDVNLFFALERISE